MADTIFFMVLHTSWAGQNGEPIIHKVEFAQEAIDIIVAQKLIASNPRKADFGNQLYVTEIFNRIRPMKEGGPA
jgi:hypothetical protein